MHVNFLLLQSGVNRKPLRSEMFFFCLKKCEIFSLNIKKKYDFTNVSWFYDTAWAKITRITLYMSRVMWQSFQRFQSSGPNVEHTMS